MKRHIEGARNPRVFIGLHEIAGFYGRVTDALRSEGLQVSFWEKSSHHFEYESTSRRLEYPYIARLRPPKDSGWRLSEAVQRRLIGIHFFFWCVRNHDVFVFTFGQSFHSLNLDIVLLRLLRKHVVVVVAHGSEIRPAFMDGAIWGRAQSTADPIQHVWKTTRHQRRLARRLETLANDLIAHPMTSQFLSKPAISFPLIGMPPPQYIEAIDTEPGAKFPLRLVHVPSDRFVKGSDELERIALSVQSRHPGSFEYTELHGLPNVEILSALQSADLLVDQLYSDTIWAGVATEAASMGVPVLVGSRALPVLGSTVPQEMIPPAFVVVPDELEKMLEYLIMHPDLLRKMGKTAKSFVMSQWNSQVVAQRFHRAVIGNVPDEWRFNPLVIDHVHGGGLSNDSLRKICLSGHERFGDRFFCLERRPELLSRVKRLFLS